LVLPAQTGSEVYFSVKNLQVNGSKNIVNKIQQKNKC